MGIHNHFRPAKAQINTAEKKDQLQGHQWSYDIAVDRSCREKQVLKRGKGKEGV